MTKEKIKDNFETAVPVPADVEVTLEDDVITVRGAKGEVSRRMSYPGVRVQRAEEGVVISTTIPRKRQRAMAGTFAAHVKNMIKGVTQGFEYKMKVVYSHFPMTVKVSGNEVVIDNYLGEKIPRKTRILEGCVVKVKGTEITVTGNDKEKVGQTVANIERQTRVRKRDVRVFQDGIYLIEKDGVRI
jgi:large subunit ribosomal protein L6